MTPNSRREKEPPVFFFFSNPKANHIYLPISPLFGKDPEAGKDWRQEEKRETGDEMVGWHHRLNGHKFAQTLGGSEGQESLVCCSPWGHKESDMTEWLNIFPLKDSTTILLFIHSFIHFKVLKFKNTIPERKKYSQQRGDSRNSLKALIINSFLKHHFQSLSRTRFHICFVERNASLKAAFSLWNSGHRVSIFDGRSHEDTLLRGFLHREVSVPSQQTVEWTLYPWVWRGTSSALPSLNDACGQGWKSSTTHYLGWRERPPLPSGPPQYFSIKPFPST